MVPITTDFFCSCDLVKCCENGLSVEWKKIGRMSKSKICMRYLYVNGRCEYVNLVMKLMHEVLSLVTQ